MQTIAIMNQKGGVGKTTLACHLAFYLWDQGKRVLVLDCDPQQNSSDYLEAYRLSVGTADLFERSDVVIPQSEQGIGLAACEKRLTEVLDNLAPAKFIPLFVNNLAAAADLYDYALIDTSPTAGWMHAAAVAATTAPTIAGGIVSPMALQKFALSGALELQATLPKIGQLIGAKPHFLGFLPYLVNGRSQQERTNLAEALQHLANIIPAKISLRDSLFIQALRERVPVWRLPGDAAKAAQIEFAEAIDAILERLNHRAGQPLEPQHEVA